MVFASSALHTHQQREQAMTSCDDVYDCGEMSTGKMLFSNISNFRSDDFNLYTKNPWFSSFLVNNSPI